MSWTPATSIGPRAAHPARMRILSKHRESTGLSRSHREGSDPVGKDSPRFAHLFSCHSTPFFSTFAHRLRAERGDAGAHSRKRKWAHSAQFWCNLSPLDATFTKNIGGGGRRHSRALSSIPTPLPRYRPTSTHAFRRPTFGRRLNHAVS